MTHISDMEELKSFTSHVHFLRSVLEAKVPTKCVCGRVGGGNLEIERGKEEPLHHINTHPNGSRSPEKSMMIFKEKQKHIREDIMR